MARRIAVVVLASVLATGVSAASARAQVSFPSCDNATLRQAQYSAHLAISGASGSQPIATSTVTVVLPIRWQRAEQLLLAPGDLQFRSAVDCLMPWNKRFADNADDHDYNGPHVSIDARGITVTDVETVTDFSSVGPGYFLNAGPWDVFGEPGGWIFEIRSDSIHDGVWSAATVNCADAAVAGAEPLSSTFVGRASMTWRQLSGDFAIDVTVRAAPFAALHAWLANRYTVGDGIQAMVLLAVVVPLSIARSMRRRFGGAVHGRLRAAAGGVYGAIGATLLLNVVAFACIGEDKVFRPFLHWVAVLWPVLLVAGAYLIWRRPLAEWVRARPWMKVLRWAVRAVAVLVPVAIVVAQEWGKAQPDVLASGRALLRWHAAALVPADAAAFAVFLLQALVLGAASSSIVVRVLRPLWSPAPRSAIALFAVMCLLAMAVAVQFATYSLHIDDVGGWGKEDASGGGTLGPELLIRVFAGDVAYELVLFAPYVIGLSIIVLLWARCRPGFGTMPVDRRLIAMVPGIGVTNFASAYAGIILPLASVVLFAVLLGLLAMARPRAVLSEGGRGRYRPWRFQPPPGARGAEVLRRQLELAADGRRLQAKRASGDMTDREYTQRRRRLDERFTLGRQELGLPQHSDRSLTALDVALAGGPGAGWWDNAMLSVRLTALLALPAAGFVLYLGLRHGVWHTELSGFLGPLRVLLAVVSECAFWLGAGFALGALWWDLLGRRGYAKVWPLVGAYGAGALVRRAADTVAGVPTDGTDVARGLVLLLTLTAVAVMIDARTIQVGRSPWMARISPLAALYRLDTFGSRVAFAVAQIAALIGLWQQLRQGIAALTPPTPSRPLGP